MDRFQRFTTLLAFGLVGASCGSMSGSTDSSKAVPPSDSMRSTQGILKRIIPIDPAPTARVTDFAEVLHGTHVEDPYRWMEEADDVEVQQWVALQNSRTRKFFEQLPLTEKFETRLTELWNYPRMSTPLRTGEWYWFTKNSGLENQSPLFRRKSIETPDELIVDPNSFSGDGTSALGEWKPSPGGKYLCYQVSKAGSDWQEARILELEHGKHLPEKLQWIKFSRPEWLRDDSGFFYSRYPEPEAGEEFQESNKQRQLYFHKVGTDQAQDILICEQDPDTMVGYSPTVTTDGKHLVLETWGGGEDLVGISWAPLDGNKLPTQSDIKVLIPREMGKYRFLDSQGTTFYIQTTTGTPNGSIFAVDLASPDPAAWKTILPEGADPILEAAILRNKIYTRVSRDGRDALCVYNMQGEKNAEVELPGPGVLDIEFPESDATEFFYTFSSPVSMPEVFHHSVLLTESTEFYSPEPKFDPSQFVTEMVLVDSTDGVRVPLFITRRTDTRLDGTAPTILFGYGGFNANVKLNYAPEHVLWVERGGIYAHAGLRGGSEYGEKWHQGGMRENKQNVFDDYFACAQYLIDNKYCSASSLGAKGRSNGGLLVGAAMTQHPELFGAASPTVGVMDMLRYQKFTIGWAWEPEFGSADHADQFPYLYSYSPLHHIKPGTAYPATLISTAEFDDRVHPSHSYKFAAALQAAQQGAQPILLRVETRSGHGALTPTDKLIHMAAEEFAFLWYYLR